MHEPHSMASSTVLRAVLAFVLLGLALGLLSRDFISLEPAVPNGGAAPQLLLSQDVVIQANVNQTQPPSSVPASSKQPAPALRPRIEFMVSPR